MKTIKKNLILFLLSLQLLFSFSPLYITFAQEGGNFSESLNESVDTIQQHLDMRPTSLRIEDSANFFIEKIIKVLFPIILIVGVGVSMVGFYTILTSDDPEKIQEGLRMVIYGVIGILIIYSAKYVTGIIFSDILRAKDGIGTIKATEIIQQTYDKIAYPFIKIMIYLSLGVLVLIMMIRVFSYITSGDEAVKKKSLGIIIWTTIGMFFIIAAKQIVEAIYGKQEKLFGETGEGLEGMQSLSQIGTKILEAKHIPIVFSIINWSLALVSFVIMVIIIIQTYKMLTKPDDEETFNSLKKSIIYALIGLVLIGSAYVLANLFIIS